MLAFFNVYLPIGQFRELHHVEFENFLSPNFSKFALEGK